MKTMDALLDEADELLERGEAKILTDPGVGYQLFQQAISNLFKVYLSNNGQEPLGDLKALFFQCQKYNAEFDVIEDVMGIFIEPVRNELDNETIIDAANEIWDFVMDMLPAEGDEL